VNSKKQETEEMLQEFLRLIMKGDNWKIRLFNWSDILESNLITFIETVFQGLWLGFLERKDFNIITKMYFSSTGMYQEEEHNLSGFWDWEEQIVNNFFKDCRTVLVGAAGGGREIIALSKRGINVEAFECNKDLVLYCSHLLEKYGILAKIVLSAPDHVPDDLGIYDGLIIGWAGYMHIVGYENRVQFLKECHEHVKPNSPIFLSFWTRSESNVFDFHSTGIAKFIRFLRRNDEPIEIGDTIDSPGYYHRFTKDEIEKELKEAGFLLVFYSESGVPRAVGKAFDQISN
jgi:hypothetical protein